MISALLKEIDCKVLFNEPLSKHTTFGIGGPAIAIYYPNNVEQLINIIQHYKEKKIQFYFLGSGSNVLVNDNGFKGIVISLRKTFKKFEMIYKSNSIYVQTGVMLGSMVKNLINNNVEGYESLIGVPGTVGGAIFMNAGAFGQEISTKLLSLRTIDQCGTIKEYNKNNLHFSYRKSSIPNDEIIIDAVFNYKLGNKESIAIKKEQSSFTRKATQPLKFRSAGSIFKNPRNEKAAGYLIDKAGLKGTNKGDAIISEKHANFIVNLGNATASDVFDLILLAKKKVAEKFNINLELEIKLIGFSKDLNKTNYYA